MTTGLILQAVGLIVSLLAIIIAVATFIRAGRWKESDDGKTLVDEVKTIDRRVTRMEAEIKGLATKADIAGLSAKLDGLGQLIVRAENAVERVEHFMMKESK